jgi:hypothetical protein
MRPLTLAFFLSACASSSGAPAETLSVPASPAQPTARAPETAPEPADVAPPPTTAQPLATFRARLVDTTAGSYEPDALLFRQAHERELAGDYSQARRVYYDLITKFPSSPLLPYAYLAFAELFHEEAEKDPSKWELARQAYSEVMKYPPPRNQAFAYALHRLGLVDAALGGNARALHDQKKALATTVAYPALPLAAETADAARHGLVQAYAAAGQPDQAFAFFRSTDSGAAPGLVVALGEEYTRRGAGREAAALYDNVLAHSASSDICAGAASAARALADPFGAQIERARKARCP